MLLNGQNSKIVAFSAWQYPYTEEQRRLKEIRDKERKNEEPEGSNHKLTNDFFTQLFAGRKKWIIPGKTFCESAIFSLHVSCFLLLRLFISFCICKDKNPWSCLQPF